MIIKNKAVVNDEWDVLRLAENDTPESVVVPSDRVIVPLKVWHAQRDTLQHRADVGVWLASDERAENLQNDVQKFAVIAVDFPIAYHLRVRLGYRGELRAIGDVLRDQMFYMQRVGFDAFAPRADKDIHEVLKGLSDFSVTYQASSDQAEPLFRRAAR
jgi:uncharacterized protein (DUF934 family)